MKKLSLAAILLYTTLPFLGQTKAAYQLYTGEGKKIKYTKMINQLEKQDLVFFGEYHNNPISHWLTLELVKDLHKTRELILGAEMFERDNQHELNEYLDGKIDAKALDTLAQLWKNFKTDYLPTVTYAKDHKISFIASNVPRRYASAVNHNDWKALDSLTEEELKWIAPLPIHFDSSIACYSNMIKMRHGHGTMNMVKAQALKDATMAHSIKENITPTHLFFHINGSYHSNLHEGIVWYIKQTQPELNLLTIATVSQKKLSQLESENKMLADFIIVVDEDMTSTY